MPTCLGCAPGNSLAGYQPDNMMQFFSWSQYGNWFMYHQGKRKIVAQVRS
jgi:hypothetical protein